LKTNYIFLALYLLIGLVPYVGAADKVVPQILYLNIVNLIAICYLVYQNKNPLKELGESMNNLPFILYFLFFIWSFITIINSINIPESLSTLGELFTLLVTFNFFIYFIRRIKALENFIFIAVTSLLTIEIISVFVPYFNEISQVGSPLQRGQIYRGYTGNINILAYVMLIKIPFIIYYQIINKGNKAFTFLLLLSTTYIITAIFATRSAILALFTVIGFIIVFLLYINKTNKYKIEHLAFKNIFKIILLPVILGLFLNNVSSYAFDSLSVQDRLGTLNSISEDASLSQRLTYYKSAVTSFIEKPLLGKGIGTWEIESIKYVVQDLSNYIVPYHAHNDFLETLAETGLPGFFLYFGIIFYILTLLLIKVFDKKIEHKIRLFSLFLTSALIVYLIDSTFNFPFDRTIQQVLLFFILAISVVFLDIKNKASKLSSIMPLLILIITPLSIYSSSRLLISSTHQAIFLMKFNRQDYSSPSLETIDKWDMDYKNITATTLPMNTIKAIFYVENEKYREAVPLLKKGMKANPYLYLSEAVLGEAYTKLGMSDSAIYYSKIAHEASPKNSLHFGNYLFSLAAINDSITIKETFKSLDPEFNDSTFDEIYLGVMANITDPSSADYTLEGLDLNIQSGNDQLKKGYYAVKVGVRNMYIADEYYQTGLYYFEEENYTAAANYFENANRINPYELAYKENAANAYLKIGNDARALQLLNELIDNYDSDSPKAHYLRGLTNYSMGNIELACKDLKYAFDEGFISNINVYQLACLQN
jgi:O-antigen ligase/tetratricopeptide (TPR) repeat protein